jgi:hypothetical protein
MTRVLVVLVASIVAISCGSQRQEQAAPSEAPPAAQSPFDLVNNLIFVRAQVNQSKPLTRSTSMRFAPLSSGRLPRMPASARVTSCCRSTAGL